jgi:hypothetical protein
MAAAAKPYRGDLFADGGVPPYTWAATSLPGWMTLTPAGAACDLSGTPSTPGAYTLVTTLTDAAGTVTERHFDISVAACTSGPGPVSQWDFDEGVGPTAGDGAGPNNGRPGRQHRLVHRHPRRQRGIAGI